MPQVGIDSLLADYPTILANCEFYNLAGEVVRSYPGDMCVPFDNGDLLISDTKNLTRLNKNNQVVWTKTEPAHHQMKKSFNSNDSYYISGYYEVKGADRIRHDTINVIDESGNLIKKFDFANYLKNMDPKSIARYKYRNVWNFAGTTRPFYEYTHVNSIYEVIQADSAGNSFLSGYIVNDRGMRKTFIFDAALKNIVKIIDFDFEAVHDVSFLDKDTLVFFVNYNRLVTDKSYISTLNIATNEKKIIYGDKFSQFFSYNNGGVQSFGKNLMLVSHTPAALRSYVDIIDLNGVVLKTIPLLGQRKLVQDAKIGNYSLFLKKNIGN